MPTANAVKKTLDKAYDKLTPKERARVASAGWWKIADAYARGEDIIEQEQEQRRFVDNYVYSLSTYEYTNYLIALFECDTVEWGRRHFVTYLKGLEREDALIDLLLVNLDRRWEQEIILAPPKKDGSPAWIAHRDEIIDEIKILRKRKRAIATEIDEIYKSDFWEVRNIERPPRPDIDPEACLTMYEEATQDTVEFKDNRTIAQRLPTIKNRDLEPTDLRCEK